MRTYKRFFKKSLLLCGFLAMLSVTDFVFAEQPDTHNAQKSLDWPGVYHGFVPCEDCKGIKTTLALNANGSYLLITQYIGKSDREIVEKGKFTWGNTSNTVVLTSRNGESTRQFLVGENTLTQLDNAGNRITGKQADRYTLTRTETAPPASGGHAGH